MRRFRTAILLIHGFTGALYDNEYLMNYLEYVRRFDVYAKTLPGHDQDRFHDSSCEEWINFVNDEIKSLISHGYHKIYVIGHSMGGVLASIVAGHHKEVRKLVLVNAAFDYLNFKQNSKDLFEGDFEKYRGLFDKIRRISPKFILEFTKLVKNNKNVIKDIKCNTLILQSMEDEIIPIETGQYIFDNLGSEKKCLTYLKDCSHIVLKGKRKEEVSEYIKDYLQGGLKWKKIMKDEL